MGLPLRPATQIEGLTYDALLYCKTNIGGYFFDGFIEVEYSHNLKITSNPVAAGSDIVDHAYIEPAEIQMKIRMSNVHESLVPGQFTGGWSRSSKAWDILKKMQTDRAPVAVLTQLGLYENMLIKELKATETSETYEGLDATVKLVEIPVARVKKVEISKDSQTTIETNTGTIIPSVITPESEDNQTILRSWGIWDGSNATYSGGNNPVVVKTGNKIKLTCYCYNCNDDGAGNWGTTATASGRSAAVGVTCAMHRTTMKKYGLKLGDMLAIDGVGTRRLDDVAGVQDILDIYVATTGSKRHCKCANNPLSGRYANFVKTG